MIVYWPIKVKPCIVRTSIKCKKILWPPILNIAPKILPNSCVIKIHPSILPLPKNRLVMMHWSFWLWGPLSNDGSRYQKSFDYIIKAYWISPNSPWRSSTLITLTTIMKILKISRGTFQVRHTVKTQWLFKVNIQ